MIWIKFSLIVEFFLHSALIQFQALLHFRKCIFDRLIGKVTFFSKFLISVLFKFSLKYSYQVWMKNEREKSITSSRLRDNISDIRYLSRWFLPALRFFIGRNNICHYTTATLKLKPERKSLNKLFSL